MQEQPTEMLQVDMPAELKRWLRDAAHRRKQAGKPNASMNVLVVLLLSAFKEAVEAANSGVGPENAAKQWFGPIVRVLKDGD